MAEELFGDVGSVKAALKVVMLGPGLEHELVKVEQRFTDGLPLERLTNETQVKTSKLESVPEVFPTVEIDAERSIADNEFEYADKNTHVIEIIVWQSGDTEENVSKKVERYLLAIRKLMRSETLMPMIGGFPAVRVDEAYGLVGRKDGTGPFVKAGAITVRLTTIEA